MGENSTKYLPSFFNNKERIENIDVDNNGLCLNNIYIPEEVLLYIWSFGDPKDVLRYSLVCHKWNNLIKSYTLWASMYKRKYRRKAKQLPWYLYYCLLSTNCFDTNLLQNGNGEHRFQNWTIIKNGGDKWTVEDPPCGADPLPLDVPEFNNKTSCFATSFYPCNKIQVVKLGNSQLLQYILDTYKPHIYISEWTTGRFDCACRYRLGCMFQGSKMPSDSSIGTWTEHHVDQWAGREWYKIEVTIQDYPEGIEEIIFEHEGCDLQFWKGHYGSKMAGGVVKLLFDSIEQLPTDEYGNEISKKFKCLKYVSNAPTEERND